MVSADNTDSNSQGTELSGRKCLLDEIVTELKNERQTNTVRDRPCSNRVENEGILIPNTESAKDTPICFHENGIKTSVPLDKNILSFINLIIMCQNDKESYGAQSSVRNEEEGNPSLLYNVACDVLPNAYRTATGPFTRGLETISLERPTNTSAFLNTRSSPAT